MCLLGKCPNNSNPAWDTVCMVLFCHSNKVIFYIVFHDKSHRLASLADRQKPKQTILINQPACPQPTYVHITSSNNAVLAALIVET